MNEPRKRWNEEETKLALFLYFQLPFGQLHSGNAEIQKLASILGRTNSSVAMKLANFASLDPKITESGRKGLQGASALDRIVWAQFSEDWTAQIEASERVWDKKEADETDSGETDSRVRDSAASFTFKPFDGPSAALASVTRRVGQNFFRRAVLANFENTCCITGIAEPTLLTASHIIPWSVDVKNRHNPANGLCLSATFDRAFDRGLVAIDSTLRVMVSKSLLQHASVKTRDFFAPFRGAAIRQSTRFDPDENFLKWHRDSIYYND